MRCVKNLCRHGDARRSQQPGILSCPTENGGPRAALRATGVEPVGFGGGVLLQQNPPYPDGATSQGSGKTRN